MEKKSLGKATLVNLEKQQRINVRIINNYESLDQKTKYLRNGFEAILNTNQLPYYINSIG